MNMHFGDEHVVCCLDTMLIWLGHIWWLMLCCCAYVSALVIVLLFVALDEMIW